MTADRSQPRSLAAERVTGRSPVRSMLTDTERAEQQRNLQTVDRFLDLLEAEDMEAFLSLWADDTRQDMPYPPPGFPNSLVGKQRITEQYQALPKTFEYMRYTDREFFSTQDPRVVIARFRGDLKLKGTDKKYDNHYFNVFVFDTAGKIVRNIEHFNPLVLMEGGAFGEGGTPFQHTDGFK